MYSLTNFFFLIGPHIKWLDFKIYYPILRILVLVPNSIKEWSSFSCRHSIDKWSSARETINVKSEQSK